MRSTFFLLILTLVSCQEEHKKIDQEIPQEIVIEQQEQGIPKLPEAVKFCNDELALSDFESQERLHRELIINAFYHSSTIQILLRTKRYFSIIEPILKKHGVPDDMKYLCVAESALSNATSPAGAKGFWQFMPETAKEFGLRVDKDIDERMNLEKSTEAACVYLKNAYQRFGDWSLAAAAYNMGSGGVSNELESQEVEQYTDLLLNTETSRYVMRIVALKLIIESPADFGYKIEQSDFYTPVQTREITVGENVVNLIDFAKSNGTTYKMLKTLNPWMISRKLDVKKSRYTVKLPVE